ncbi:transmembrane 9 superfamily member 1 isoform X1, partial [Tachysurus ichikawai]
NVTGLNRTCPSVRSSGECDRTKEDVSLSKIQCECDRTKEDVSLSKIQCNTVLLLPLLGIIIMALLGMFNVHRHGAINSAAIVLYALTSCVSGYCSCSFYTQIHGHRWVWNIILTSTLFSGETVLAFCSSQ